MCLLVGVGVEGAERSKQQQNKLFEQLVLNRNTCAHRGIKWAVPWSGVKDAVTIFTTCFYKTFHYFPKL